jgi:hypothetical protein
MNLKQVLLPLLALAALAVSSPSINSWIPIGQSSRDAVWQLTGTGSWYLDYSSPFPSQGSVIDIRGCNAAVVAHLAENGSGTSVSDTERVAANTFTYFSASAVTGSTTTPGGFTGIAGIRVVIDSANAATTCYVEVQL